MQRFYIELCKHLKMSRPYVSHMVLCRLQLLTRLLEKYPSELPMEQLPLVLGTLQQLVVDVKRTDIERWVLKCLLSLARCLGQLHLRAHIKEQCHKLWQKVYLATIR